MKTTVTVTTHQPMLWLDTDIAYALVPGWWGHTSRSLQLSVLRHLTGQPAALPCIVWVGGGGYFQMDRHAHLPNLSELARAGFVVASVDYRTSNEAKFPAQIHDIKAAIRFLRAHAELYQIDPNRISIMGESAGGHLAAVVALTNDKPEFDVGEHLDQSSRVASCCPWYPPVSAPVRRPGETNRPDWPISPEDELVGGLLAQNPDLWIPANPLTWVTDKAPPFLILHGDQDQLVPLRHGEALHDALEAQGVPVELLVLRGADHGTLDFHQPAVKDKLIAFFSAVPRLTQGFHHVALRAFDLDKTSAFYTQVLGMPVLLSWGEGDKRGVMLDTGEGSCLEVFAGGSSEPRPEGAWFHIALRVTDLDAVAERVRAAGCTFTREPVDIVIPSQPPLPARIAFFKGPDGEVIELFQTAGV